MPDPVKPWSETRSEEPVKLPEDLACKNVRLFNPLATADLYFEFYDNAAEEVVVKDPATAAKEHYELVGNFNHADTSSAF